MKDNLLIIKKAMEEAKKTRFDYQKRLRELKANTDYSDEYKEKESIKLVKERDSLINGNKEKYNASLNRMKESLQKDSITWKNADEPSLASTMSLISMGVQPPTEMIKRFQGDFITLSALSEALQKQKLQDITEPFRVDFNSLLDNAIAEFNQGIDGSRWHSVHKAASSIKKVASAIGEEFEIESSEEEKMYSMREALGLPR